MYKTILVAMALDHDVSPFLLSLARSMLVPDGTIQALHVLEEPHGIAAARLREDLLDEGLQRATTLFQSKLSDHPDVTPRIVTGHVSRTILGVAEETSADCIVMGSHRPGMVDYFIGSTAARVVRHATCSVHVYRQG